MIAAEPNIDRMFEALADPIGAVYDDGDDIELVSPPAGRTYLASMPLFCETYWGYNFTMQSGQMPCRRRPRRREVCAWGDPRPLAVTLTRPAVI